MKGAAALGNDLFPEQDRGEHTHQEDAMETPHERAREVANEADMSEQPANEQKLAKLPLAGLELPDWVAAPLEAALRTCEEGFTTSWILSDRMNDLGAVLREIDIKLFDLEVSSRLELSRYELESLLEGAHEALQLLRDAVPEASEMEEWADSMGEARDALRRYLIQRQYYKLKLGGNMRTIGI
jgi:hypothetical protein